MEVWEYQKKKKEGGEREERRGEGALGEGGLDMRQGGGSSGSSRELLHGRLWR